MTATIADPESSGSEEVPSGDGNCECADGKYTLKIKPLKVRYDSMLRRQIKVYIKYTATIECGGEVTKTSDMITITTNGNDHSFPANTEILDFNRVGCTFLFEEQPVQ